MKKDPVFLTNLEMSVQIPGCKLVRVIVSKVRGETEQQGLQAMRTSGASQEASLWEFRREMRY